MFNIFPSIIISNLHKAYPFIIISSKDPKLAIRVLYVTFPSLFVLSDNLLFVDTDKAAKQG